MVYRPIRGHDIYMDSPTIWFLIGLGLVLAEFFVPGVILVFLGVAAWIVAILDWAFLDSFTGQLWVFGIVSIGLVVFVRKYVKAWFAGKESAGASDIDEEFIGKSVEVVKAIRVGSYGLVELKGSNWKATSESDLNEGDYAEVVERVGLTLKVIPRR